jgi:integrase
LERWPAFTRTRGEEAPIGIAPSTVQAGRRLFRSTKETDRKLAWKIALAWEGASEKARRRELTAAQARKVLAELVAASSGEELTFHSTQDWLNDWLSNKAGSASAATMDRYRQIVRDFLEHLGPTKARASIASVSPADLTSFRNHLHREGRTTGTCNTIVKGILNSPLQLACRLGYIPSNPVSAVERLRKNEEDRVEREPFTTLEVSRLLEVAQDDWYGAILLGASSGLRLGDVTYLRWESVDLENRLLRVATKKTGKRVVLPMHGDLFLWLSQRQRGIGKAPVFPSLACQGLSGGNGLSSQFKAIVAKAQIVGRVISREGKGRASNSKTFRALRHSFISRLANAGVSPELRQKLAGHASPGVHELYTHHEIETLRAVVERLPGFSSAEEAIRELWKLNVHIKSAKVFDRVLERSTC